LNIKSPHLRPITSFRSLPVSTNPIWTLTERP
jgi:hypothetical protein